MDEKRYNIAILEEQIRAMSPQEAVRFAWLCAVRALPFLGRLETKNIWGSKNMVNLFPLFHAIDICLYIDICSFNINDIVSGDADRVFDAAARVADSAAKRAEAVVSDAHAAAARAADTVVPGGRLAAPVDRVRASGAYTAYATAVRTAAYVTEAAHAVTRVAVFSANLANRSLITATYATDIADTAASHVINAATAAAIAAIAAGISKETFFGILLNDIHAIITNNLSALNNDTNVYRGMWEHFLEDLKHEGCGYWAELYENLFKNRFVMDKNELERRLFQVPDEIKDEGASAVGRYLTERLSGPIERLNEARIIILGEKGAGKTSLARRLRDLDAEMPGEGESTEGVVTSLWRFPDKDGHQFINAHIWDFAGHSITHAAHRCFMSARCLYIYLYNGRIERDNDPVYWLEQIRIHGGSSPVLVLINKKDERRIDIAPKTLKGKYPSIVDFYTVDIGSDDKRELEEFQQAVMETVRDNPSWNKQATSKEAYEIKNELRECFDKFKSPHITRDEFDLIAQRHSAPTEKIEGILDELHILGICLWYNQMEMKEFRFLVLNPDWITNGIYRIINKGYDSRMYTLTVDEGVRMLVDDKDYDYPFDKVEYLFKLMKLYELAYFKDTNIKDAKQIFIPGILPLDRPDGLPEFNDASDRLTMVFSVEEALPPNMISRVIVQRNEYREIDDENMLWREGAVLKYSPDDAAGDTIALIIEDKRSITVRVKGSRKTEYIASLRETLKDIFNKYRDIKPDLKYEILIQEQMGAGFRANETPIMLDEETIVGLLEENLPHYDVKRKKKIPLPPTGKAYSIEYNVEFKIDTATIFQNPTFESPFSMKIDRSNSKTVQIDNSTTDDHSTHTFINVYGDMILNLQGELNDLARGLRKKGFADDADYIEEVADAFKEVEEIVSQNPEAESGEQIKRKGLLKRIKGFFDKFTDKSSDLLEKILKLRDGLESIQSVLRIYNDVVKMIPGLKAVLPEAPDFILNLGKDE